MHHATYELRTEELAAQFEEALLAPGARWDEAWATRQRHHPPTIRFDRPTATLPVSLTGTACSLGCAHCNGVYLQHMRPVWETRPGDAKSYLISGGCDAYGRVPVVQHLDAIERLHSPRQPSGAPRLNWHVGLIDELTMQRIAPYVDVVSFDVVGDRDTAREVYGLDLGLEDYMHTYDMLRRYARVVPHLTIGLRGGAPSGEHEALRALAARGLEHLVYIILIPTEGTRYARCAPPPLPQVADLFLEARLLLPRARVDLGCMRPYGPYRRAVDELAVRAGCNVIVNPSLAAQRAAERAGLEIIWGDECCALD